MPQTWGALWSNVRALMVENMGHQDGGDEDEAGFSQGIETDLQTCEVLEDMVSDLINRLPPLEAVRENPKVRQEVLIMWKHYVQGQREILASLLAWVNAKGHEIMRSAEEAGIQFMAEEDAEENA